MVPQQTRGPRARTIAALTAVLALVAGCGQEPSLVEALAARQEAAGGSRVFLDVSELTVNHLYQVGDRAPAPLTEAVVRGRVSDVLEGRAFAVPGGDAPDGTEVDFDDGVVQWRTFHAQVEVTETISGAVAGSAVVVGLAFGPSIEVDTVRRDLLAIGEVVLFLERSPVFAYDRTVYGIVGDGALLASVDTAGRLALPVLPPAEQSSLLSRGGTLGELRAIARRPPTVIHLDPTGTHRTNRTTPTHPEPQSGTG